MANDQDKTVDNGPSVEQAPVNEPTVTGGAAPSEGATAAGVTTQYPAPGGAVVNEEDEVAFDQVREEQEEVAEAQADLDLGPTYAPIVVQSPEAAYATKDNILLPDADPEVAEAVERVAEDVLGCEELPGVAVEVDPRDAQEHAILSGDPVDPEVPFQEAQEKNREDAAKALDERDKQAEKVRAEAEDQAKREREQRRQERHDRRARQKRKREKRDQRK